MPLLKRESQDSSCRIPPTRMTGNDDSYALLGSFKLQTSQAVQNKFISKRCLRKFKVESSIHQLPTPQREQDLEKHQIAKISGNPNLDWQTNRHEDCWEMACHHVEEMLDPGALFTFPHSLPALQN
ncbi:hypothetical protein E4U55_005284 [Claviceps digitariae]|nr:hypothetical protein E4U55_005284 [Claviceps digitariae]